jgi:hypothetical protein
MFIAIKNNPYLMLPDTHHSAQQVCGSVFFSEAPVVVHSFIRLHASADVAVHVVLFMGEKSS